MKNVIEKMEMIWKLSICVLIIMILVSSTFYDIWVGDSVKISLSLSGNGRCLYFSTEFMWNIYI